MACILIIPVYLLFSDPIVYDPGWPRGQWAILLLILCGALEVMLFFYLVNKTGAVLVSFASIITLFFGDCLGNPPVFGNPPGDDLDRSRTVGHRPLPGSKRCHPTQPGNKPGPGRAGGIDR